MELDTKRNYPKILNTQNSWIDVYQKSTKIPKTVKLLGEDFSADQWLLWRVKWGQRGTAIFSTIAVILNALSNGITGVVFLASGIFCFMAVICCFMFYYKNISIVVVKRLLHEPNVILMAIFGIIIFIIDSVNGGMIDSFVGFVYALIVVCFVFLDAIKIKSRVFVLGLAALYTIAHLVIIYRHIFGTSGIDKNGVERILLEYNIQGQRYTFMTRATKRSIFIQVVLFSLNGFWILLKDQKMEMLLFATGNIYRETGTASATIKDEEFHVKMKRERENTLI